MAAQKKTDEDAMYEFKGEFGEEGAFIHEERAEAEEDFAPDEEKLTSYNSEDFGSGAVNALNSTIPLNTFEFEYSYGYNCHKYFNLCACDDFVVCWSSGSYISFMDVTTAQIWFRRSSTGGTVGAVTSNRKDPNYCIAIAEDREGDREPLIIIYKWPMMEIEAVLKEGTTNAYSVMDFSPNGELLASVGKEPDYNLTIWNWKRHRIMLRTSAFTFDVNNVMFSPYCPGQLTTAGAAHIKFWKMAETFTGLKLKGELGRFGKTEICDVLGILPMPDEKVLSGCEWGNILVWEAGLVKVEVTQRARKKCHSAPIIQFMLSQGGEEVTTIARDGCIRAWYWDTVEQADPPEDDQFVELNPVAETCVPNCQIFCLKHQKDSQWYGQDGNGGIWTIDLEIDKIECDHRKVMTCHAGPIVGMAVLRTHDVLVTAGQDGCILFYERHMHRLMCRYVFPAPITSLLYPPIEVDESSRLLLVGFGDGILRTLMLYPERLDNQPMIDVRVHSAVTLQSEASDLADAVELVSLLKPHSKGITQITINEQHTLLVTAGQDSTIFMYSLVPGNPFTLERLGYFETPNNVAFMTWKPGEERTILLCGQVGCIIEAELPELKAQDYEKISTFQLEFASTAETLLKKQYMRHRPFPQEEDLASLDEETVKAQEDVEFDDDSEWVGEVQLIESESMLGTTITWASYCDDGVWVVQQGTGALFLIKIGSNKILKYAPIEGAWTDSLSVLHFVCNKQYILMGTNTGYIRMFRMPYPHEDDELHHYTTWTLAKQRLAKKLRGRRLAEEEKQPTPRCDLYDYYYLPMHDRYSGAIKSLEFSLDGNSMYSCASDGNIFAYTINFPEPFFPEQEVPEEVEIPKVERAAEASTREELMSHEQLKQKEEYDKMMAIANAHKKKVRDQLNDLTVEYNKVIKLNRSLPFSQQIDVTLDERPLVVQESELDVAKALTIRKLAHQLEASDLALHKMHSCNIVQLDVFPFTLKAVRDPKVMLRPLRQKNLSKAFYDQLEEVHQKMAEAAMRGRRAESITRRVAAKKATWGPPRVASFLLGLPPKRPHPLKKALKNYRRRLHRHHNQFIEWQEHLSKKPDPKALPPGAEEALREAEMTIGNKLLKSHPDYVAPHGHNTQLRVCLARKEIYDTKREFNVKVLELREHKVQLVERMKVIQERLAEIKAEIPPKLAKDPPPIPVVDENMEFPEHNLKVKPEQFRSDKSRTVASRHGQRSGTTVPTVKTPNYPQPRIRQTRVPRFITLMETRPLLATWELLKSKPEEMSPLEIEIRDRRIGRHLYEQDMLLAEADVFIRNFDARLMELQRERIRVQEKNQLLELHICQLHREMNVLNRFEAHEDRLAERVYDKLMQVKAVQEQIHDCEVRIEEHVHEKERLTEECQEMQRQFKKLVQDNKFADFLRRIFKKKYRPPRIKGDDDSTESESESSSSEEEDEGSIDSRDIGPIRLDPNFCPEGCDQELFDKTYEMRNEKHKLEHEIIDQDHMMDMLRRDIDAHGKVKRQLTMQLDKRKTELREFMMEKQSCMNEIEQVVVLNFSQMRASALRGLMAPAGAPGATGVLGALDTTGGPGSVVIFPEAVLARLRNRVLELQAEISEQKMRHKVNRTHLFRMNIDLKAMAATEKDLRAQIRDVLSRKLGKPRKVDKVLDSNLRQMARRHKFMVNMDTKPQMIAQLGKWRDRYGELEQKYLVALDHYSTRLRLAAALQADLVPSKAQKEPPPDEMAGGYDIESFRNDVVRLRIVRSNQREMIKLLRQEITKFHFKEQSPRKKVHVPEEPTIVRSEIFVHMIPPKWQSRKKYFPITPLGSQTTVDANLMMLLIDCCDVMRISRDETEHLLEDASAEVPHMIAGTKSRYEVVDKLARKWVLKHGGDPTQYKKQTKAFDALAALCDKLMRTHVELMEGSEKQTEDQMKSLEVALKDVAGTERGLKDRIGPAIAALLASSDIENILVEETMTALVSSLTKNQEPLTAEIINQLDKNKIISDIKDCGVTVEDEDIMNVVAVTINCLKAQIVTQAEKRELDKEVEQALFDGRVSLSAARVNSAHSSQNDY